MINRKFLYGSGIVLSALFGVGLLLERQIPVNIWHLCFLGGAALIFFLVDGPEIVKHSHMITKLCGVGIALWLAILNHEGFMGNMVNIYAVKKLLGFFFEDWKAALQVIGWILAFGSVFFFSSIFTVLLHWLIRIFRSIRYKELFMQIKGDFRLRQILMSVLCVILAAVLGLGMLIAAFMLPGGEIQSNARDSAFVLQAEGPLPVLSQWYSSMLDNYTDSLILGKAAYDVEAEPLENVLLAYRGAFTGANGYESFIRHYAEGEAYATQAVYPRYWHGYLIFVRPLLTVLNYAQLRIVNLVAELGVVFLLLWVLYRKGERQLMLPVLLGYLMLDPLTMGKSLQFAPCFYISMLGALGILLLSPRRREQIYWVALLICGILTAYFDFLTYPIATLGVPLIFTLALMNTRSTEQSLAVVFKSGYSWGVGYAGMWSMKWILVTVLTDHNGITDAMDRVSFRMSHGNGGSVTYTVLGTLWDNVQTFLSTPAVIPVLLVVILFLLAFRKEPGERRVAVLRQGIPYAIISLFPLCWYAALLNHSSIHSWFTNKALLVSLTAILVFLCKAWGAHPEEAE